MAPLVCPCRRVQCRDPPTVHQEEYKAILANGFSEGILPTILALHGFNLGLPHVIYSLLVRLAESRPHAQLESSGRGLQTSPEDLLIAVRLPSSRSLRHQGRSVHLRHRQMQGHHLQARQLEATRRSCLRRGHQWLLRRAAVAIIGRGCHFQRMGRRPSLARSLSFRPRCYLGKYSCQSLQRIQARTRVLPLELHQAKAPRCQKYRRRLLLTDPSPYFCSRRLRCPNLPNLRRDGLGNLRRGHGRTPAVLPLVHREWQ